MSQQICSDLELRQLVCFKQPLSQFNSQMFLDLIFESNLFDQSLQLLFYFFFRQHLRFKILLEMKAKWKIFLLTFLSYALIHAVRTSWSSLKYVLNLQPFAFSPLFLGVLDMCVLVMLALSLNILGPRCVSFGPKKSLQRGVLGLCVIVFLLGLFLLAEITVKYPYAIIYPLVGILSCVGWPTCIYILSLHFEKGMIFSIWYGCTQFGDFTALFLSYLFIQEIQTNPGLFLFVIAALLGLIIVLNKYYLPQVQGLEETALPEMSPAQKNIEDLIQEKEHDHPPLSNEKMSTQLSIQQKKQSVNFLTVWKLPGVSGYILSFIFVKSVNAMISTWLVFYLSMIDMVRQANIIALLWSVSTFIGGIFGAYINPMYSKKLFIGPLFISAIFFVFLEELHLYPHQTEIVILIMACGLIFGGPFTVMNTSIPLFLSQKPAIKQYPGAKAAIISAMQGYPLLFCGVSLLIVPAIGVINLHWMACLYCISSALILLWEDFKQQKEKISKDIATRRSMSQPVVKIERQVGHEWSLNMESTNHEKKRRRPRRKTNPKSNEQIQKEKSQQKYSNEEQKKDETIKSNQIQQQKLLSILPDQSIQPYQQVISSDKDTGTAGSQAQPLQMINQHKQIIFSKREVEEVNQSNIGEVVKEMGTKKDYQSNE